MILLIVLFVRKAIVQMEKEATSVSKDNGAYLFVHFINDNDKKENTEQIYFSVSKDGLKWDTLNGRKAVLTSKLGDLGVRDPFIIRSPKENKFYIIATDLSIYYRKDWGEVQRSGSQCVMIWESTDIVNWSEQRMVKIGSDTAGCVWAPEAIYDKKWINFLYIGHQEKTSVPKSKEYTVQGRKILKPSQNLEYILKEITM